MKLSSSNIKKIPYIFLKESFSYIFSKDSFSYIYKNRTLQFSAQAMKIKGLYPAENFLCFKKWKP